MYVAFVKRLPLDLDVLEQVSRNPVTRALDMLRESGHLTTAGRFIDPHAQRLIDIVEHFQVNGTRPEMIHALDAAFQGYARAVKIGKNVKVTSETLDPIFTWFLQYCIEVKLNMKPTGLNDGFGSGRAEVKWLTWLFNLCLQTSTFTKVQIAEWRRRQVDHIKNGTMTAERGAIYSHFSQYFD
jgi:hypothetical protein